MAGAKALPALKFFAIILGFPEACGVPGLHRKVVIMERTSGRDTRSVLGLPFWWIALQPEKPPLYH